MNRADLIVRLIEAGFEQKVDRSEGAVNKKGEPLVSYKKTLPDKGVLNVELRRSGPGERYNCGRYDLLIDDEFPDEQNGDYHLSRTSEHSPATIDGKYVKEWGSTAEQVIAFLEAEGGLTRSTTDEVDIDALTFRRTDWQYTKGMGVNDLGRIDTIIDVEGHPHYDGIRWFFFPGGGGEVMEWMSDGEHLHSSEAPIPDNIRKRVMELVVLDMREKLKTADW